MIAEIPPGYHTGAHKHGEETIFFLSGAGFSIVDGVRYEWKEGSMLHVPFSAPHQHFNTGEVPVQYISALMVGLEHYVGLQRTIQLDAKGKTLWIPDAPVSSDGLRPDGKRCVLHKEQATPAVGEGGRAEAEKMLKDVKFDANNPLVVGDWSGMRALPIAMHKAQVWRYMRMEAHLFTLAGEGYSEVGDRKVPWKKGTAFHVQGPQTPHRHVNTSDEPMQQLRIAYGVRYFFEKLAKREYPYLFIEPGQSFLKARNVNVNPK
jgi:mannose-6-phosphate isomerase-like protein (cupin superfamily)